MPLAVPGQSTTAALTPCATAFGSLMRQARTSRGLSQSRLAELAEVDVSMVSRWEQGTRHPKPETMRRVVAAISLTDLEIAAIALALWRGD